jgi:phosphatidylinositol kinase/protein kinase (PI-3  family)
MVSCQLSMLFERLLFLLNYLIDAVCCQAGICEDVNRVLSYLYVTPWTLYTLNDCPLARILCMQFNELLFIRGRFSLYLYTLIKKERLISIKLCEHLNTNLIEGFRNLGFDAPVFVHLYEHSCAVLALEVIITHDLLPAFLREFRIEVLLADDHHFGCV